jgi:hypothetical protein
MNKSHLITFLAAVVLGAMCPSTAAANTVLLITVDTSSLSGQNGYLDLQFEPDPLGSNPATATVTDFAANGILGAATPTGDVTGTLPGALTFDNQTVFNDYWQEITFGSMASFTLALAGPTPQGGGPSAFNIAFYASDTYTPLLTVSPDGESAQIVLNPDGTTTIATFAASTEPGSVPAVTVNYQSSVPEPASFGLAGLSLAAVLVLGRKRWAPRRGITA